MTDTSRRALVAFVDDQAIQPNSMGNKLLFKAVAQMLEADAQEIALYAGTVESRDRNIETLRAENVRLAQQVAVPETTDHSFIRAYEVGASVYRTQKEAARAISLGECERWTPLYRKQGAKQ